MHNLKYWLSLGLLVWVFIALWAMNKPARADVAIKRLDIGVHMFCSGDTVDELAAECKAAMKKLCPSGGYLSDVEENPADAIPREIQFTLKCKEPLGV